MHKFFLMALAVCTLAHAARAVDPMTERYEDAHARALHLDGTEAGKTYGPLCSKAIASSLIEMVRACVKNTRLPSAINLVVILDADGSVLRALPEPGEPVAECLAAKLAETRFPPPPQFGWPVFVTVGVK